MGQQKLRQEYDLYDLGMLDGPATPGMTAIVAMAERAFDGAPVGVFVLNHMEATLFLRVASPRFGGAMNLVPIEGSLTEKICKNNGPVTSRAQVTPEIRTERRITIGAPFHGPTGEPLGSVVVAVNELSRDTEKALRDVAQLVTDQVMLRATLETLKRVSVPAPRMRLN